MSWLSQNYEKAAIGGAAVVALGLAFFGWSKVGSVEEDFPASASGRGNRDAAVANADRVPQARAALDLDRNWARGETNGRPVDLFTGVPLFVDREAPQKGLDPMTGAPIHPPIPNTWWLDFELDPGFADSPQRDPDEDGFTNLEEFEGGTDPTDPKSHPSLADKLAYRRDESIQWILRPGVEEGGGFAFEYADSNRGSNRASLANPVQPGDLFFGQGAAQNRFKLVGSEKREEMNPRTNIAETKTWVRIEDQRPNKKGLLYEIPALFPRDREDEFTHYDRTAVLTLEALGLGGQEFKVEENTVFSLPPGSGADDHKLLSVTPESIEVEYPAANGERRTITIPRR